MPRNRMQSSKFDPNVRPSCYDLTLPRLEHPLATGENP